MIIVTGGSGKAGRACISELLAHHPGRPESAYSLSKLVGEEMAKQFCRWDPELKIIGLRFSNIMEPHDYARFLGFQDDARKRKWNFWGYIDARDSAQALRLAVETRINGAHVFIMIHYCEC